MENNGTMTTEEQLEQLKAEIEKLKTANAELSDSNTRLKVSVSKANSEAAENKRKWQQTLSDAEKAEEERKEAEAATKAQLEELLKEKKIAKIQTDLLSTGFTKKGASDTAKALIEGDMDGVVVGINAFIEVAKQQALKDALKTTPKPGTKGDPSPREISKAQFSKMDYTQLVELKKNNPELYKQMTS